LGVVVALAGLGVWLWRPLHIRYLEWRVEREDAYIQHEEDRGAREGRMVFLYGIDGEGPPYLDKLRRYGPKAYPAFDRLLGAGDARRRKRLVWGMGDGSDAWAMPLLVRLAGDCARRGTPSQDEVDCYEHIVWVAERISGESFSVRHRLCEANPFRYRVPDAADVTEDCGKLLCWWEEKGKAKYGGNGK
jgi:hypothetical protein